MKYNNQSEVNNQKIRIKQTSFLANTSKYTSILILQLTWLELHDVWKRGKAISNPDCVIHMNLHSPENIAYKNIINDLLEHLTCQLHVFGHWLIGWWMRTIWRAYIVLHSNGLETPLKLLKCAISATTDENVGPAVLGTP